MSLSKLKWIIGDLVAVLIFVVIGTRNHNTDTDFAGVVKVALPFVIAVLVAWLVLRPLATPLESETAIKLWLIVIPVAILLRRFAWDESTAGTFVIVATAFICAEFVAWRALIRKFRS